MQKMCSASRASAIFLLLVYVRNGSVLADDDDPSGYTRAGMKICPCFCSVRTGDDQSPYWDEHFGSETLDEKILSLLNVQALVWRFLCTKNICKTVLNT